MDTGKEQFSVNVLTTARIVAEKQLAPFVSGTPFASLLAPELGVIVAFHGDGGIYSTLTGHKEWVRLGAWSALSLDGWAQLLEKEGWTVTRKPPKEDTADASTKSV